MKPKNSFILYKTFYEPISELTDEQLGRLFRTIFRYQIDGSEIVDEDIKIPFRFFLNQFKLDEEKYQNICKVNAENGKKGGKASGSERKRKEANGSKRKHNEYDNDNENDIISPKGYEGFDLSFIEEPFKDTFYQWLEYKKDRKEKYKTQGSIQIAYKKLKELSEDDKDIAKQIVEQSMANNWAGLFDIKPNNKRTTGQTGVIQKEGFVWNK